MKSRLIRPALAALVAGAVVAGGAVYGSPALAEEPTPAASDSAPASAEPTESASESPSAEPSESVSESPSAEPSESASESTPPSVEPSVSSATPSQSPAKDTRGPDKANFRLNYTSVWLGQKVTFSQTSADLHDPTDEPSALKRIVAWGDGTTTTLSASTTSATKTYSRKGSFKVTVTVTDPAGNRLVTAAKTVGVTVATGTVTVSKKTAYHGQRFTVTVKKVPAGATHFLLDWSDGWPSWHKAKNGTALTGSILYQYRWDANEEEYFLVGRKKFVGKRPVKISWYNAKGYSVNQTVGTVNLLKDPWKPTLTITKPSPANKASAWRTIKGTATDKGAGVRFVAFTMLRETPNGALYCLNGKKQWKRYYSGSDQVRLCLRSEVALWTKVVKGKWTVKVPAGVTKGQGVLAYVWTWDDADNGRTKTRGAYLTRN
ncbi:MAG TPA: PKD domain-containing protein [Actinoplanes sp.]|nr:PKD domain-containing protein [Actinoplanes sp.]